jgi:Replication initiator protein A
VERKVGREEDKVVPLFGKDEMNLIEFPFGPISATTAKTLEVEHQAFDRTLRREVTRKMIITGADKFGLPRPIDDQVLVGMKALTHEAAYASRKVEFSRYHLCQVIGWEPDGRAYQRLEESFDRIAGTTLKFKDAWWDKGEKEFKSKTFHLIEEVDLCSGDRLARTRLQSGRNEQKLCSFVWTDAIWKSFQDGYIKTLDMRLFRRIAQGRRREVPLRLFRILDKRFYHATTATFDLRRLCVGTLGMCPGYAPSQMARVLDRASNWLIECEFLEGVSYSGRGNDLEVHFRKRVERSQIVHRRGAAGKANNLTEANEVVAAEPDSLKLWIVGQEPERLESAEAEALATAFGSELVRNIVADERSKGIRPHQGGRIRQEYVRRFLESGVVTVEQSALRA